MQRRKTSFTRFRSRGATVCCASRYWPRDQWPRQMRRTGNAELSWRCGKRNYRGEMMQRFSCDESGSCCARNGPVAKQDGRRLVRSVRELALAANSNHGRLSEALQALSNCPIPHLAIDAFLRPSYPARQRDVARTGLQRQLVRRGRSPVHKGSGCFRSVTTRRCGPACGRARNVMAALDARRLTAWRSSPEIS